MELIDTETLEKYAFINASKHRKNVVKILKKGVNTPSGIAKELNIKTSLVSGVFRDLKEAKMVECINEEAKKGKLYGLIDNGKEVADKF